MYFSRIRTTITACRLLDRKLFFNPFEGKKGRSHNRLSTEKVKVILQVIYTYIHNLSLEPFRVRIINLVSQITYFVCVNFIYKRLDLQFNLNHSYTYILRRKFFRCFKWNFLNDIFVNWKITKPQDMKHCFLSEQYLKFFHR